MLLSDIACSVLLSLNRALLMHTSYHSLLHFWVSLCNTRLLSQSTRLCVLQILQQIPTHIVLSILHQLDFLSCIRNLPAAYHALAIEAHHSEVMKKKQLRMAPARQHCDESVHAEVVTAIAELQQLTSLQLHGFWISQCKSVMQKRLRALFTSLHNLRELQFPDGVNSGTAQVLMDSVESLSALETLDILGHTQVAGMQPHALPPQELNGLLHSFRDMRALKSLTLSGFKRDSEEMVEFCAALKHLTGLTKLELSRCFLKLIDKGYVCTGSRLSRQVGDGLRVTQRLGGALKKLKLLEHLDLSHSFPRDYVEPVLDAIACLTKLTCLNLQDMNTMSSMRFEFPHNVPMNIGYGKRLVPMLNRLQQLQCINLSSYPLFEDVWPGLGAAMASLTKLTALILERVAEGEAFWDSTFCPNVTHLVNLRMLSLSGNYSINDRNAWAIGKALAELPALQTLYMCTCEIRREGAVALSGHFKSLTGLTQLALRDNRMGPRGAKAIAESLKCMLNLSALSLTFHCIGSEGARAIKSALVSSLGQDWIHQMSYCSGLEPGILGQDWEASDAEFEEGVQVQWQQWHAADMAELLQAPPLIALHWFQAMMLDAMI